MAAVTLDQTVQDEIGAINIANDKLAARLSALEEENAALKAELKTPGALLKPTTLDAIKAARVQSEANAAKAEKMAAHLPETEKVEAAQRPAPPPPAPRPSPTPPAPQPTPAGAMATA
jgi:ParB-like chromosome segregation protein Spo0J